MSLGCAYAGACALLTRAQFKLTRQHWETTSLRGAYAELTRREMLKNDTSPQVLLTPAVVFSQEEHFLKALSISMLASATEGQCASKKIKHSSNDSVSLGHCKSEKAFVWVDMWATARKVNTSLRAAYAELVRSLCGISPWCCLTMTIMGNKNFRENAERNHS